MKRDQYNMFCKLISSTGSAMVKGITFTISKRPNGVYQLIQCKNGINVVLATGTRQECVAAAKDCVEMMFNIKD